MRIFLREIIIIAIITIAIIIATSVIIIIIRRLSCEDLLEREGRPLEAEERRPKSVGTIPGRTKYDQNDVMMMIMIMMMVTIVMIMMLLR